MVRAAEVIIGGLICWVSLSDLQAERMTVTIALAGAVYLTVRGFDNYYEGRNEWESLRDDPVDNSPGQD
jgi:hypothetical protein